jgi:hypothetical protein
MPAATASPTDQRVLSLGPLRNSEFLSNHWLENRLPIEPEWRELRQRAQEAASRLSDIWNEQANRVERYGDEAGLEHAFIQPVFEALGWKIKYQAFLDGREPDYALFLTDDDLDFAIQAGRHSPEFWRHAVSVADAKAWHISLDRPTRTSGRREYPPEQIEWYLDRSRADYGFLTNGRFWRLVPRVLGDGKPRFQTFFEVDLPYLLRLITPSSNRLRLGPGGPEFDRNFMPFYMLFSADGFRRPEGRIPLIQRAADGSSEFAIGVGEGLRTQVFEALKLCIEGFLSLPSNGLNAEADLAQCREHSLVLLYRLLFIMYGEDRGLLPHRLNAAYTSNRSLARHRDEVAVKLDQVVQRLDRTDYSREETGIWQDLVLLFDLIDGGHGRYGVPPYNGGLFNTEHHTFLAEKSLPDWHIARVLDELGRTSITGDGQERFRVDYRDLAIQQLGGVYEGLLEMQPRYADEQMVVVRKEDAGVVSELVIPASQRTPTGFIRTADTYSPGSIYLVTDKGERRATGSYYTPDHVVRRIVEQTLGALCRDEHDKLQSEIDACENVVRPEATSEATGEYELEGLKGCYGERVMQLRVLDPAMGSGHFLIRACQFLAEDITTSPYSSDPFPEHDSGATATIVYWKRRVAETCLFGVDANSMAVELAKLALWLETVSARSPLTFLDHHLQEGDSLIGARIKWLGGLPGDSVISGEFADDINAALPTMLGPLREIEAIPSDTKEQVKRKERIFANRFRPAVERFETVADIWCAAALSSLGVSISRAEYSSAVEALRTRALMTQLREQDWVKSAGAALDRAGIDCMHRQLAFPEVFLGDDAKSGFDAVIGNPPYEVLAPLESGPRAAVTRSFVQIDPELAPSAVGKNNLYKLFVCRALELLRDGGYLSFIVPMPLLGDMQARGVRTALFEGGAFTEVHAFPQKDDPRKRIFKEAKLSTCVFFYRKSGERDVCDGTFQKWTHPENMFDLVSPSLALTSAEVKRFDPINQCIVSCDQADWDLVRTLGSRPGISRLGQYAKQFQGEVNETNDGRRIGVVNTTPGRGRVLALRGAAVCQYVLRDASQGNARYIDVAAYRQGASLDSKAFHGLRERVGFQRSAPQQNYRRLIAAYIPAGELCFDTVSYIPAGLLSTRLSLDLMLALLNSKLLEWSFRLGSTNSKVNEYQFDILPCPVFRDDATVSEQQAETVVQTRLGQNDASVRRLLPPSAAGAPFSRVARTALEALARKVRAAEEARGEIGRRERSRLSDSAQRYQDEIDAILFDLAGFSAADSAHVQARLRVMI